MTLRVPAQIIRLDLKDRPLIDLAVRDQAAPDQLTQPCSRAGVELIVVSCHCLFLLLLCPINLVLRQYHYKGLRFSSASDSARSRSGTDCTGRFTFSVRDSFVPLDTPGAT